ncbi:MAG: class I SAM-dependent RNA methyltransferase [Blastocatellia bacterium]
MSSSSLSIGDIVDVTTERLAYGGDAVARHDGLAIFIPLAAPRERLRVRITEHKKTFARAVIERVLAPSPSRREAPCEYFGVCGGCQLQHLSYEAQLESKTGFVRDALERIGRIDWPREIKIRHGAEFGYRGRAQLKMDRKTGRVGYNRAASNGICDVVSCPILVPELDQALQSLRSVVSNGANADLALSNRSQIEMAAGETGVAFEPVFEGLPGGLLKRTVNGAAYSFSPSTFFQANPGLLGELVDEAVGEASGDLAIDLYSGVGLFAIQLARRFKNVIGVEADRNAARFAVENASANAITNVQFQNAAAELWLNKFIESKAPSPDVILLDPPRTGAAETIAQIAAISPAHVTYVSCDPATMARDLRTLIDSGYELSRVTAIDLFPQTYHVETVALLTRH